MHVHSSSKPTITCCTYSTPNRHTPRDHVGPRGKPSCCSFYPGAKKQSHIVVHVHSKPMLYLHQTATLLGTTWDHVGSPGAVPFFLAPTTNHISTGHLLYVLCKKQEIWSRRDFLLERGGFLREFQDNDSRISYHFPRNLSLAWLSPIINSLFLI